MEELVPGPGRRAGLRGRSDACALLDGLTRDIRRGESRSLVLWGEAGIGKTALLESLIESASDLTVLRAMGVESEMELAYASLHQLCAASLAASGPPERAAASTSSVRAQLASKPKQALSPQPPTTRKLDQ